MKFFQNLFPVVSLFLEGGGGVLCMLLTSENNFTLQTNEFIASDEIVSATHVQIQITLQRNKFIASDESAFCAGDEHFWRWGRTLVDAGDEH